MEPSDRDISIKVLRPKTRALICDLVNPQMFIPADNGTLRYWKGLAALCKINPHYEASLVEDRNPTGRVLDLWHDKDPEHCTVSQFLAYLEEMDRFDVIDDTLSFIDSDILSHRESPRELAPVSLEADKYIITDEDLRRLNKGLALVNYDAFLLYHQDDIEFATQLLENMEKKYNLRFCVRDRDLLGGGLETDKIITLITERCNRLVVILSDSFFQSTVNDYFLRFAHAYGIEKERKIIPCIYQDLTVRPAHIGCLFMLDYRRMQIFNFWEKLRDSIVVPDPSKVKISRSKSDNGQGVRAAIQDRELLRPSARNSNVAVKFSSSVGDLKNLKETAMNPSTSADHLETTTMKKEKKHWWNKKIKSFRKREKASDCTKEEHEKNKGFLRHFKRAAAVAN